MMVELLILTKSFKHKGYCVAGINTKTLQLLRLCGTKLEAGALQEQQCIYSNGCMMRELDLVSVEICNNAPTKIQPENVNINESIKMTLIARDRYDLLHDYMMRLEKKSYIFYNTNYKLTNYEATQNNCSLMVAYISNLDICKNESIKTKASFSYNNNLYNNISVTISNYNPSYEQAIAVFSLPDDTWAFTNNNYFKYISAIYPVR